MRFSIRTMSRACLLFLLVVCGAIAWERASPEQVGMDEELLEQARNYGLRGGSSGCVIRGGKLVMTWGSQDRKYDLYSTTKSIGVSALGLAIQDGKLRLTDKAKTHLPGIGAVPPSNQATGWLDEITIFHLATHTAGFEKTRGWCKQLARPGSAWIYSDGGANWLADVLTAVYGRDLRDLMTERVFTPLGISIGTDMEDPEDLWWGFNGLDRPNRLDGVLRRPMGAGIWANVEAMAKIGYLYLRRGRWDDQQILPASFVDRVQRRTEEFASLPVMDDPPGRFAGAPAHYGLMWWNNADGALEGVPRDAYWSWGLEDSLIVVVPSLDLVIARAGKTGWGDGRTVSAYKVIGQLIAPICQSVLRGAPYPPSPAITSLVLAPESSIRSAGTVGQSDVWVSTWADDDNLYTVHCDGYGFQKEPGEKAVSLGFAKITGGPRDFVGTDFPSDGECCPGQERHSGAWGRKGSGILMVDGVLYLWVRNANSDGTGEQSQLGWSTNRGRNWQWADWKWKEFGYPAFINFGRNYTGVPNEHENYVYVYSPNSPSGYNTTDTVVLMRVATSRIREKSAYEYFAGPDSAGRPRWTPDVTARKPAFEFEGGCSRLDVTYNAPLRRYLMTMRSGRQQRGSFTPESDRKKINHFGIYDAPQPWGPWTTVYFTQQWEGIPMKYTDSLPFPANPFGWGESEHIPSKWISDDGRHIYLIFAGEDSFRVRMAELTPSGVSSPE
jgi:CubicO group peptidase (beta-lactamase class C family)